MVFECLDKNTTAISALLLEGKVGVVPTDTLYGFSCSALNKSSVERIYRLKKREDHKPFIILTDSVTRLINFDIKLSDADASVLNRLWPDKVSVIVPCENDKFEYLHRGTKQLAFRIPNHKPLLKLLGITGPLVSTSVNVSGEDPVADVNRAVEIFAEGVDFYVDTGVLTSKPTTVLKLTEGLVSIVRQGDYIVDPLMLK
jgi:L-threonylcarbamoyladenylate synthase